MVCAFHWRTNQELDNRLNFPKDIFIYLFAAMALFLTEKQTPSAKQESL